MKYINKTRIPAFILILASFLISCATQSIIIETPYKTEKQLPQNIQSVLLISRVADDTYTDSEDNDLQRFFYSQGFDYDTTINDYMVVDTTLQIIGDILFESGRYDYVIPEDRFLPVGENILANNELSPESVKNLCNTYNTDALISIDQLKTRVLTSTGTVRKSLYYPPNDRNYDVDVIEAKIKISYEAVIRVYDPSQEKVILKRVLKDNLFWEDFDLSEKALFTQFTSVKKALLETGVEIALDFSDDLVPDWKEEERELFVKGNKKLKKAVSLAKENQWDMATELWSEVAEQSQSATLKSKAEFNIALGYELQGDLNQAIKWALKSYETMYRTNTYNYLEALKLRKINL